MAGKNLKIFNTGKDTDIVFKDFKESGMTAQKYFYTAVFHAITKDFPVKKEFKIENYDCIQFRMDATLHEMLKEKAKKLNRNMDETVFLAAIDLIKNRPELKGE